MKECPVCQFESSEDADTCKTCGTAFFFQPECLQPPLDNPEDTLMVVGNYADLMQANMALGLLEAHGIAGCIPEELTPRLFANFGGSAIEPVTVCVARKDFEEAQRILAEAVV